MGRTSAKKMSKEIQTKVEAGYLEIGKAEELVMPLVPAVEPSEESLKNAEQAVKLAGDKMNEAQRLLDLRLKTATGLVKEELEKNEEKIKECNKKLEEVRSGWKDVQEKRTLKGLLPEVSEKMKSVTDAIEELEKTLGPF